MKRRDQILLHDLSCTEHEEADTQIIAHIVYSANHFGHKNFVVHATDTDIIILYIYHLAMNLDPKERHIFKRGAKLALELQLALPNLFT